MKDLNRHMKIGYCTISEAERRLFQCDQCDKTFTMSYHLKRHINGVHLKTKDFQCSECVYRCTNSFNLGIHIKVGNYIIPNLIIKL